MKILKRPKIDRSEQISIISTSTMINSEGMFNTRREGLLQVHSLIFANRLILGTVLLVFICDRRTPVTIRRRAHVP